MSRHSEDGRKYRTLRRQFLAANSTCWICHHTGSNQIDHDPPRAQYKAKLDMSTWRPAHGNGQSRCPTCGRSCNQERGTKPIEEMPQVFAPVMQW